MRPSRQTTLSRPAVLDGVGLHTGAACSVALTPAPENFGIRFEVADGAEIAAGAGNVFDTKLGTSIRDGQGRAVRTIEHLMAAAAISGVDNLRVKIAGEELPILDGSAAPFVAAISGAGVVLLDAPQRAFKVISTVEFSDGASWIRATPDKGRIVSATIEFDDAAIGRQSASIDLGDATARRRLAGARTFCRLADVNAMRAMGLSLGGSLENAIVVDGARVLNGEGLRDEEEFALHKVLDLVGDLALAGAPIYGRIEAFRPGHDINVRFLKLLLKGGRLAEIRDQNG